ncbi:hypothetical protein O181_095010 [Austropuccinia psidii MF-1]|uniref:Uncharacterized protein n=1 Tax=Austropuccinia psidii MF-1 TaxID=1389203 RepID=A0A9Q3J4R8_9BASI|nr:hypothetical protein [Austropuccinia psidii MF-1]
MNFAACIKHLAEIKLPKYPPALNSTTPLDTPPHWHNLSYFEFHSSVLAPFYNSEPILKYSEQKSSPALKPLDLDDDSIKDPNEQFSPTTPSIYKSVTLNGIDTFSSIDSTYSETPHCELTSSHDKLYDHYIKDLNESFSPTTPRIYESVTLNSIDESVTPNSIDESVTLNIIDSFSSSTLWLFNSESTLEYLVQTSSPILKSSIDDSIDRSLFHIPDIITSPIALKNDSPESLKRPFPAYCSPTQRFSPFCLSLSPVFPLDSHFKFFASGRRIIKIEDTGTEVDELDPVPYAMALPVVQSTSQPACNTSPQMNHQKMKKRKQTQPWKKYPLWTQKKICYK